MKTRWVTAVGGSAPNTSNATFVIGRQIDFLLRLVPTERIFCTYNPKTRKITLAIRKKGIRGEHKIDYDAWLYWPNFRTNERIVQ